MEHPQHSSRLLSLSPQTEGGARMTLQAAMEMSIKTGHPFKNFGSMSTAWMVFHEGRLKRVPYTSTADVPAGMKKLEECPWQLYNDMVLSTEWGVYNLETDDVAF
jgi:hypothetical protein